MGDYTGMTAATDPLVLADSYAMSATTYRPRPLIPGDALSDSTVRETLVAAMQWRCSSGLPALAASPSN